MPATYTLINSNVLTSSAASVTFSSIPATYTDLVLRCSIRSNDVTGNPDGYIRINGSTSALGSTTTLAGTGAAAASYSYTAQANVKLITTLNGSNSTANTFASTEIYIPNYAGTTDNKVVSSFAAQEGNVASPVYITAHAGLWRATTAISQIDYFPASGNLASGSSFYLYGISNT